MFDAINSWFASNLPVVVVVLLAMVVGLGAEIRRLDRRIDAVIKLATRRDPGFLG